MLGPFRIKGALRFTKFLHSGYGEGREKATSGFRRREMPLVHRIDEIARSL